MRLTLAAVGAVIAALLQSTIVPYLVVATSRPDLLVVYVVAATTIVGFDYGLVAAFVGGLTLDALALRPLGSTAFVLLLVAGGTGLLVRPIPARTVRVIVGVFLGAVLAPLTFLVIYGALRTPVPVADPLGPSLGDAIYATLIALLAAPLLVRVRVRYFERERIDW